MPTFIISPNMDLQIPDVGIDPGPDWANNLNASLTLIDQHDHSPGHGVLITPSGLNIDVDLTFQDNNATNVRSVRFFPQSSPLSLVTDLGCLYESGVDLWYNDGNGNQVKITNAGSVNATTSGIFSPPASAQFVAGTLVVDSNTNTPANIQGASILLGNNVANSKYLTLQPPNAMGANYAITLPAPNAISQTAILTYDTSNNILATVSLSSIQSLVASGTISMFGGTAAPTGYLICDGTSYLRTAQPTLFAAIGTAYGTADGTHFNVPDFRGLFPRGVDNGAGNDPNTLTRTAANPGGNTGDNVGSYQVDGLASHTHDTQLFTGGGNVNGQAAEAGSSPTSLAGTSDPLYDGGGVTVVSAESRPKNLYVNFIIKT
jgi:microcystin-dependent protein